MCSNIYRTHILVSAFNSRINSMPISTEYIRSASDLDLQKKNEIS